MSLKSRMGSHRGVEPYISRRPGCDKNELKDCDGLAVGDTVEVEFETNITEGITVVHFSSIIIIISAPTRYAHQVGSLVRRLIEGTEARFSGASRSQDATSSSCPRSSVPNEPFSDHASWSPGER